MTQAKQDATDGFAHEPVMLARVLQLLEPVALRPDAIVVDATIGLGGHAEALLDTYPGLRLIGIDRDPAALRRSADRLATDHQRISLVHAVYDELSRVLGDLGLERVDGVLLDLGVSSMQLDDDTRGFAYSRDTDLDMRMDPTAGRTAGDFLNGATEAELATVIRRYGEERFARRIAAAIVARRRRQPITSSVVLAELVRDAVPAATRRTGGHPAKRTFQALRIAVNDELDTLGRAMPEAIAALAQGGRIVVLAYHSLEDRIVKQALVRAGQSSAPADLPVVPEAQQPQLRLLTRGAELADPAEIAANPRAQSVRLRAAERIREAA